MYSVMEWTKQRQDTFRDRYALKSDLGEMQETSPEQMWRRVASYLARNKEEEQDFYWALEGFRFVPAGRILSGIGAGQLVTFYNCFVLGVEARDPDKGADSRHAIMHTTERMVEITSRGGGVGVNWGALRPDNTYIRGVNGRSSGAVAWMSGADEMIDKIRQGGTRTAALMYILPDWHPDILQFIDYSFKRANHSIAVSDAFMEAVRSDGEWVLRFPDTTHHSYDELWDGDLKSWENKGLPVVEHARMPARELLRFATEAVVRTGNPGMVFMERANRASNTWYLEDYVATNPCGEQFLPRNGCCNLGAMNLAAFWDVRSDQINMSELSRGTRIATTMLDRVIDLSPDISPEIGDLQRQVRRVGLGTMGLADTLIKSHIRYGSQESLDWIDKHYAFVRDESYRQSIELAKLYGPAPAYSKAFLRGEYIQQLPADIRAGIEQHGIRNLTLINQAPTGTTSVLAGVSSGIEPNFADVYVRRDATGEHRVVHPLYEGERGSWHVTAMDIPVEEHIAVQATVQRYLDNAISKTINCPEGFTPQQVADAYLMAYDAGVKGITVYVDKSREGVLQLETDAERTERLSCGDECEIPVIQHEHATAE